MAFNFKKTFIITSIIAAIPFFIFFSLVFWGLSPQGGSNIFNIIIPISILIVGSTLIGLVFTYFLKWISESKKKLQYKNNYTLTFIKYFIILFPVFLVIAFFVNLFMWYYNISGFEMLFFPFVMAIILSLIIVITLRIKRENF